MSEIGFLGAGAMGEPMAARLRGAGHDVLVGARRPERARELRDAGFAVGTLAEALARPVVVSCLRDAAAVREVFLGSDGGPAGSAVEARPDGGPGPVGADGTGGPTPALRAGLVIEHATVDPATSRAVAAALAARGVLYVDAPVSGGPAGAATGTLVAMCGGTDAALAAARPYLEATCARIVPVGGPGAGVALKIVNQLLVAAHSVAAAEAAALVRVLGVDPDAALEALMGGWAASRRLELQFTDAVRGSVRPDGAGLEKFLKDLDLADEALAGAGVESTLLPGIRRTWEAAAAAHPEAGFAALAEAYGAGAGGSAEPADGGGQEEPA
ncbi:NAD(P)-dependent oxidoreductase [Citricoccus sp. SGAir0253]|uniref:NAD(P)-dependent oxidoreductase n=1 Tax=Citricoccus sp. SGAir0253 TaxID=2567881 RepID=UPI0010CD5665|nr:NAD(P)-dependent oxidoreductase [Citricoccus sp. SGAir0253]QCU77173.1 NAD(P)-dependent oxidoreductase [Citricoccus sp. SGAir0253]